MNKLEITERHICIESEKINWHESIHSGKEFGVNEIRLRVQFGSFVLNPQHFIGQTFEFATAFLYDLRVFN